MYVDSITGAELYTDDVRAKFMPLIVSDLGGLSALELDGVGIARVEFSERPTLETGQSLEEGWNKSPGSWVQLWNIINPALKDVKASRSSDVMIEYQQRKLAPVFSLGHWWRGGFESAQGIKGAHDLAEAVGSETITLFDADGLDGTYSLADAKQVALDVGLAYQIIFGTKEHLLRAIKNAESADEVSAVAWPE